MEISNNISSLQANQQFFNTTANNIANVNTENFKSSDTRVSTASGSPHANTRVSDDTLSSKSQTSLNKEIPNQIIAEDVSAVNIQAIKTQDEMLGSLLDIKA